MSDYEVLEVEDKFELFWNVVSRLNWILLSSHGHTQRDLLSSDEFIRFLNIIFKFRMRMYFWLKSIKVELWNRICLNYNYMRHKTGFKNNIFKLKQFVMYLMIVVNKPQFSYVKNSDILSLKKPFWAILVSNSSLMVNVRASKFEFGFSKWICHNFEIRIQCPWSNFVL